ncbi:hypothetical protein ABR738_01300 [Streptomyces sp. Edi4]|uniref:hypothetical protein n=1 Tax=Streptomyces sp. Edi4 TaxID=3162527 RepID=UPI0033060FAA
MSVIGQEEGIEHGTVKGYRQHTYRKVSATEECGCLPALREYNANRPGKGTSGKTAAKKRPTAAAAQQEWNGGQLRGAARPEANLPVGADCPVPDCGRDAAGLAPAERGWVRIQVNGSRDPARDYCSGSCATFGIALAELRMADPESTPRLAVSA